MTSVAATVEAAVGPLRPAHAFGSWNVLGPQMPVVRLALLVAQMAGQVLVWFRYTRGRYRLRHGVALSVTWLVLGGTLLSRQYLLWMLPWWALADWRPLGRATGLFAHHGRLPFCVCHASHAVGGAARRVGAQRRAAGPGLRGGRCWSPLLRQASGARRACASRRRGGPGAHRDGCPKRVGGLGYTCQKGVPLLNMPNAHRSRGSAAGVRSATRAALAAPHRPC